MAIPLSKFIINLVQVQKDLPNIIKSLLEKGSENFVKANVESWNKGNLPSGEKIENKLTGSSTYSLSWSATRKEKGLPYDHYYLQYTGELARSIIFDIKLTKGKITGNIIPQSFVIDKANDLNKMFGDVFGIPKENITIFVEWFRKELITEIKKRLFAA